MSAGGRGLQVAARWCQVFILHFIPLSAMTRDRVRPGGSGVNPAHPVHPVSVSARELAPSLRLERLSLLGFPAKLVEL